MGYFLLEGVAIVITGENFIRSDLSLKFVKIARNCFTMANCFTAGNGFVDEEGDT